MEHISNPYSYLLSNSDLYTLLKTWFLMDLTPIFASFLLITLAELCDKTQLAIISLSSCANALVVFTGAMLAFILVSAIGVAIGDFLSVMLPSQAISFTSAVLFLVFGIYMILTKDREECFRKGNFKYAFLSTFSIITLMELGDKTQLTVIALTAKYGVPAMVYIGVIMAFTFLTGFGVLLGRVLTRKIRIEYIKLGSGVIFLLFGMFFLFEYLESLV